MTARGEMTKLVIAVLVLAVSGCFAGKGEHCNLDSDCRGGLLCFQYTNTCETPCTNSSDCGEGLVCLCELDRECPEVDEDTELDDVQGGACLPDPSTDADTDADAAPDAPPDATDVAGDPDALDVETPDLADVDCGHDGAPDVLPDGACVEPSAFVDPVLYMRSFSLGEDGHPGSGLDLDGNPSTCSPSSNCSGGIDNGFYGLGSLANAYLPGGANGAETHIVVDLAGYSETGCPFAMNFFAGTLTTSYPSDCESEPVPVDCCPASIECDFTVPAGNFDADCRAVSTMGGMWVVGTDFRGGPIPGVYYLMLSVVGLDLLTPVHEARMVGTVTTAGGVPSRLQGIIGGYIREDEYLAAFEAIHADDYPFPGKEAVIQLMRDLYDADLIHNDRDLDGDTVLDAGSVGIIIDADIATISGVSG
ncbi:MAG: hypothetical protein JRG91_16995 [Deltaproteobacteria bacterium]|nr:hypothetical protein [Deltaproteobacteria bacterium]